MKQSKQICLHNQRKVNKFLHILQISHLSQQVKNKLGIFVHKAHAQQ